MQSGCHIGFAKSVAFNFFTTCHVAIGDLVIECLGVHAIESFDVLVATNFVRTFDFACHSSAKA